MFLKSTVQKELCDLMDDKSINLLLNTDARIQSLKDRKLKLIEKITKLNAKLRYKQYEQKALEPFLEQTKHVRIGPLRKRHRQLEFTISTQAYTPKIERDLVKEVKKVEAELAKVLEVEKARRKKNLVDEDIGYITKQIAIIESELKKIRDELAECYEELHANRKKTKHGITNDHMMTLADIAVFEKEN